jgi:hypothetical protein
MGRQKRGDMRERRIFRLRVKLTATEQLAIADVAAAHRVTISRYVRELVLAKTAAAIAVTKRNPEAHALTMELHRIGNNLNQLAHQANAVGDIRFPGRLDEALEDYKRAVARVMAL